MTDHAQRAREIHTRIIAVVNAAFDCGAWSDPEDGDYRERVDKLCEAQRQLNAFIAVALDQAAQEAVRELAHLQKYHDLARDRLREVTNWAVWLDAQLQAAQPVWSTDKPKVAGWYWFRMKPDRQYWEVCHVIGVDPLRAYFTDGQIEPVERIHQDCEWAGPLPMPREA